MKKMKKVDQNDDGLGNFLQFTKYTCQTPNINKLKANFEKKNTQWL